MMNIPLRVRQNGWGYSPISVGLWNRECRTPCGAVQRPFLFHHPGRVGAMGVMLLEMEDGKR